MYKYKFKVEIEIDEEKVIREGEYNLEKVYEYIKVCFTQFDLIQRKTQKKNQFVFTDRGDKDCLAKMGLATMKIYETKWLRRYVTKFYWLSYDHDGSFTRDNIYKDLDSFVVKGI